jgi:hypothetical protein
MNVFDGEYRRTARHSHRRADVVWVCLWPLDHASGILSRTADAAHALHSWVSNLRLAIYRFASATCAFARISFLQSRGR